MTDATPTPDTNSGETPTPRTHALHIEHMSGSKGPVDCYKEMCLHAESLERELSRPVAPVTGMPQKAFVLIVGESHVLIDAAHGEPKHGTEFYPVDVMPAGSRERLRALEGWLEEESGLDCENEGLLNKTPCGACSSCRARKYALTIPTSPCLCGHTLGEHVPDKDIGCTGFRAV